MSGEAVITARGLALGYDRAPVLRDVDWTVLPGEAWFLLGPNGRGKSTLLRAVLGQMRPLAGELRVSCGLAATGFVPQRCDINPALPTTVREFVSLGLVNAGVARHGVGERIREALSEVKLDDRADASYWSLSGGQRQRALLARALVRRPRLLILDEPTNGLDVPSEELLLACISDLRKRSGITVLFVTHDLPLAFRNATHVALFAGDGVLLSGPRGEMLSRETLRSVYGCDIALEGGNVS